MLLVEIELRDSECYINHLSNDELFYLLNLDKKFIHDKVRIDFMYSNEAIDDKDISTYWNFNYFWCTVNNIIESFRKFLRFPDSERFWLDFLIPILFIVIWIFLLLYKSVLWG